MKTRTPNKALTGHQTQVVRRGGHQVTLSHLPDAHLPDAHLPDAHLPDAHLFNPSQPGPATAACLAEMRKAAFDDFTAPSLQAFARVSLNALAIAGHRTTLSVRALAPVPLMLPLWFGDVRLAAKAECVPAVRQCLRRMIGQVARSGAVA